MTHPPGPPWPPVRDPSGAWRTPYYPYGLPRRSASAGVVVAAVLAGVVGLAMLVVVAVFFLGAPEDESGVTASTGGRMVGVNQLRVGQCFIEPHPDSEDSPEAVKVLPCSSPHNAEVTLRYTLAADTWPGYKALDKGTDARCKAALEDYVDAPYDDTPWDFGSYSPSKETFQEDGDRLVVCVVYPDGRQVSRSARHNGGGRSS